MANVQKTYALILGIVLFVIGVWGFFSMSILGIFGVNIWQSVLHVIAGIFGVYVGTKGEGKGFNSTIGWIGLVLGILGFIPSVDTLLLSWLNINAATTWLHLVIGVVSLAVYFLIKE